jgi:exonuclease III
MTKFLKLAVWNANGLYKRAQEFQPFLQTSDIDVLLVSETHITNRSHITIPNYNLYHTPQLDATDHGATAVIIRKTIKHHLRVEYRQEHIQATSITLTDNLGDLALAAVYSPPSNIKADDYERFFQTLGHRFIAGGDYNAKNTAWGSRITTTKG